MNILVISDLHIGNNDLFDTFGWKSDDFISALEYLKRKKKIAKIVLNGDIFELYKYSFEEIYKHNKKLLDYLSRPEFVILQGNHDAINKFGKENYTITNPEGKTIYIEHGHSVDFMNGSKIGRRIQTFSFSLLRSIIKYKWIRKIYFRIVELDDAINHIPKKYDSYKYLKHALKLLKTHDMVIMGHTHKIETHKTYYLYNKKQYINCGSCSMGRLQGVVIDTHKLKHYTLKYKNLEALLSEYPNKKPVHHRLAISA